MSLILSGQIGNAEMEFGIRHTDNRMNDVGRNFLLRSAAQALIEDGSYSLLDPYASPENVLNAMRITLFRDGKYDQDEVFGSLLFNAFELAGGPVTLLFGAEHRQEKYADLYDPQSEAEQVGGSVGNSAVGKRDVSAVFFEAFLPVVENAHVIVAGRYDDHSDFGDILSPLISANWQPIEALSFHAQYSEDFAAPDLAKLNSKPITTFSSVPVDYIFADERRANPFLTEETIEQFSVGLTYQPVDWFSANLDFWQFDLTDRIRLYGAQTLINLSQNGQQIPTGLGCFTNPAGQYTRCISGYGNGGTIDQSGFNLNLNADLNLWGGSFNTQFQMTQLMSIRVDDGVDLTTRAGIPPIRARLSNTFNKNNWSLTYQLNYISAHQSNQFNAVTPAPTWVTHDFQLQYSTSWQAAVTVGVKNAGEKSPPIGAGYIQQRDYDLNLYDGFGRIVYARYTQTF